MTLRSKSCVSAGFALAALGWSLWAGAGGSLSGTVTDPQGLPVFGAVATVVNTGTNVQQVVKTDLKGIYSFLDLAVGAYEVRVEAAGFKPYRRTGVLVNTNGALLVDVALEVGGRTEALTLSASALHVETNDTQLGEVITGSQMTAVPLNGRSFTDLLALQPGVAPATTITGSSIQAAGAAILAPSGNLNPGTMSINGQREYANGFTINDTDAVERFTMGVAVIPNLDSIAEFRILTGNFDSEYGNYSGGGMKDVPQPRSNQTYCSPVAFLRNTLAMGSAGAYNRAYMKDETNRRDFLRGATI